MHQDDDELTRAGTSSGAATAVEVERMSCAPHRVLGVRRGRAAASLLVGLTDDVDCAVVDISIQRAAPVSMQPKHDSSSATASASAQDPSSAAGPSGAAASDAVVPPQDGEAAAADVRICVQHLSSIPALAYVAAGKVQRKAVLLAVSGKPSNLGLPDNPARSLTSIGCESGPVHADASIAAALVEAQAFAYVYRSTTKRQVHGDSALIDLQSDHPVAEVLGAALLTSHHDDGGSWLLVLTASSLESYRLK